MFLVAFFSNRTQRSFVACDAGFSVAVYVSRQRYWCHQDAIS